MSKGAYYNENDDYAAQWLRNLVSAGLIPDGDVDERSIADVQPGDLKGYTQCHFFAGLGGWAYAARLASWPDDRPLWTGSCPCQPFSVAGKGRGADDERHLWPDYFRLIRAGRPAVVMGEQVAGKAGYGWLDGVRSDLAGEDYASRGVDIPACSVDAPHIRSRLYWVAQALDDATGARRNGTLPRPESETWDETRVRLSGEGSGDGRFALADAGRERQPQWSQCDGRADQSRQQASQRDDAGRPSALGDADQPGPQGWGERPHQRSRKCPARTTGAGFWDNAAWLVGADGKARRAQPGIRLLVNGISGRVAVQRSDEQGGSALQEPHWYNRIGALKALGNAIVPPLAAEVIAAFMESE